MATAHRLNCRNANARQPYRRQFGIGPADHPDEQDALAALRQVDSGNRLCGAEINSISHLMGQDLQRREGHTAMHLHFLGSDTRDGEWTVRVLELYYGRCGEVASVSSQPIEGLSGDDCDRFARTGLRNLVKACARCLTSGVGATGGMTRVIIATGGYKAQISFAGLIGQVLKVPVVYLFRAVPRGASSCRRYPLASTAPYGSGTTPCLRGCPMKSWSRPVRDLVHRAESKRSLDRERIDNVEYTHIEPNPGTPASGLRDHFPARPDRTA